MISFTLSSFLEASVLAPTNFGFSSTGSEAFFAASSFGDGGPAFASAAAAAGASLAAGAASLASFASFAATISLASVLISFGTSAVF